MRIYLTVSKGSGYEQPRQAFEREVPWTVPPNVDETVFFGKGDDGDNHFINARIIGRVFETDGISVEASISNCRHEYDDICKMMVNDGFKMS
jgi:hypothetical protein